MYWKSNNRLWQKCLWVCFSCEISWKHKHLCTSACFPGIGAFIPTFTCLCASASFRWASACPMGSTAGYQIHVDPQPNINTITCHIILKVLDTVLKNYYDLFKMYCIFLAYNECLW